MSNPESTPIVFLVPGIDRVDSGPTRGGSAASVADSDEPRLKHDISVATRRDGNPVKAEAMPGKDIVVIQIAGGPELYLHPENARDLMLAQQRPADTKRGGTTEALSSSNIVVPMQLTWQGLDAVGATRSVSRSLSGVIISAFKVVTGQAVKGVGKLAASAIAKAVDDQVKEGVYQLKRSALESLKDATPVRVNARENGSPVLVLIHGTFSDTLGTFGKLWSEQHHIVDKLFDYYGGHVYALDHRTLGASPIDNAKTLADALGDNVNVHLLTHSRGGLVAEVMARVCGNSNRGELDAKDAQLLQGSLDAIVGAVKGRGIQVTRMVRVGCPARGTLLASKRLDAYISVVKWGLTLAQIPVFPHLVELIGAIAREKANPETFPGLQAQMPDSALVRWLHASAEPIPGDLRVIAGDLQGDSVISWLKTLLADSFFWTDNDLVVQSRSMYGGAPRSGDAQFVFTQGGAVSHFTYFKNDHSAQAVLEGLVADSPAAFTKIGPLSWAGEESSGFRAGKADPSDTAARGSRPLVFVIPGIFGSHLAIDGKRVWMGPYLTTGFKDLEYNGLAKVKPDGVIGATYDRLTEFLAQTHDVVAFAYDWRLPMEQVAELLADQIDDALDAREQTGQPVRILAHSSGGLVARAVQLVRPQTWERMLKHDKARVLLLGTPNAGSFAPMQILSGDDTLGNVLSAVGAPFTAWKARDIMAKFPGLMEQQAGLEVKDSKLRDAGEWERLAAADRAWLGRNRRWHALDLQLENTAWGVPTQETLTRAADVRSKLNTQLESALSVFQGKVAVVIGQAGATPDGYDEPTETDGFVYLDLPDDGDGRVTRRRAMLPGAKTWQVRGDHGSLTRHADAFAGYVDLLETGDTKRLEEVRTARSADERATAHQRSRPSRATRASAPPASQSDALRLDRTPTTKDASQRGAALRVTVMNGDLTFVGEPLMLGHYRSLRLTGTERVMDELIGGTMQQSLSIGRYPVDPGANQIFDNIRAHPFGRELPRPKAVIIVGLGDEGSLRAEGLIETVRQGVLAWSQRVVESTSSYAPLFEFAATLMGSGGAGISAGDAAQCIVQGAKEANDLLDQQDPKARKWPRVGHLKLIELYLERATEAWQAVRVLADTSPALYALDDVIAEGNGSLRRPIDSGYRGADYDFVSALSANKDGDTRIAYSLDTRRARTELRDESVQLKLVRGLVSAASNADNTDGQIGYSLFRLLVPPTMKPFLEASNSLVLELEPATASIPWELLDTPGHGPNALPWAIRTKLLRKLRLPSSSASAKDANAESAILVIGDPACDRECYPFLDGAREEALAVVKKINETPATTRPDVKDLIRGRSPDPGHDARSVINALFERGWRIVHISGHGEPPEWVTEEGKPAKPGAGFYEPRGVVLSKDSFLGPREFRKMIAVPELVFMNCCHLAAHRADEVLAQRRADFAAGVAESLIDIGVRCVIAAAWAVDDEAAETFAGTFYQELMRGRRFIDAVSQARLKAQECGGNTWAAYQCYGDPDWTFTSEITDAQSLRPSKPGGEDFSGIASRVALKIVLDSIAVDAQKGSGRDETDDQKLDNLEAKLEALEGRFGERWGNSGEIAQAFGMAWNELGHRDKAVEYLAKAVGSSDSRATIGGVEQFCNTRARLACDRVLAALRDKTRKPGDVALNAAFDSEVARARTEIADVLEVLARITMTKTVADNNGINALAYRPSLERGSLWGSSHKRMAMIFTACGDLDAARAEVEEMVKVYALAMDAGRDEGRKDLYYPGLNILAGKLVQADRLPMQLDATLVDEIDRTLKRKAAEDPDFWSVAGQLELDVYRSISQCELATHKELIASAYANLNGRVNAPRKWDTIFDTAYFVLNSYAARDPQSVEAAAATELLGLLDRFTSRATP